MTDWPFANPVWVASGCGGTGRELAAYVGLGGLGAFVTRSVTLQARAGAPGPRVVEAPSGVLNAIGLQNPGVERFLADDLPVLRVLGATVVVSIAGVSLGEYAELARTLGRADGVSAIELNLSVPGGAGTGILDAREPFQAASVVAACRRDLPRGVLLLAKVRSDVLRVVETCRGVADAGADGVVVGNALPAAMPDGRPAGLSGPAIGPLTRRCVAEVVRALPALAVVAAGGIMGAGDARAYLDLGARAVQVGSALFHDPTAAHRVLAGLTEESS